MTTDDTINALRDELQRLRIERTGLMTDLVEELKAEVARLRAENDDLRARVPKKKQRGAYKRKIETVVPSSPAEGDAVLDELTKNSKTEAST